MANDRMWLYISIDGVLPIPKGVTPEQFRERVTKTLNDLGVPTSDDYPAYVELTTNDFMVDHELERLDKPTPEEV